MACSSACACRLLEVDTTAAPADIKAAFRRKALALHPDVNSAPDATERFTEVSQAYGVSRAPPPKSLHAPSAVIEWPMPGKGWRVRVHPNERFMTVAAGLCKQQPGSCTYKCAASRCKAAR